MPGAPWRSSGCNTCVKRKVKCDLQRPQCARCLRGGHHCGGYERTRKFIHTFADPGEGSEKFGPQKRGGDVGLAIVNVNSQIRSQLFSLFVESYVPSHPVGRVNWRCQHATNLVQDFPSLMGQKNSQLFDRAVTALATSFVGKKFGDERLTRHGIMLYNSSIQAFAKLIPRSGLPVQEVLCANVAFQLYEIINCTYGFMGWMAHMQGANAVMARYEKVLEKDQLSILLLRQLKLSNIFHAIGKSKSALDSFPMWRSLTPEHTEPLDDIIDILMECTGLVEDTSNMKSEDEAPHLIQSCWSLKRRIDKWYENLQVTSGSELYSRMKTSVDPNGAKPIFADRYEFVSVEVAESHMLFWAASLIVHTLFYEFQRRDSLIESPHSMNSGDSNDREEPINPLADSKDSAEQICCGVGYFLQPHMHILGGHSLLFPVSMASKFFHMNGFYDQYQQCQDVFTLLESSGLGLASVLLGTPWATYKSGDSAGQ